MCGRVRGRGGLAAIAFFLRRVERNSAKPSSLCNIGKFSYLTVAPEGLPALSINLGAVEAEVAERVVVEAREQAAIVRPRLPALDPPRERRMRPPDPDLEERVDPAPARERIAVASAHGERL